MEFFLDTGRPVDLSETWIAGGESIFIDAEAERIGAAGGIDVAGTCISTGSRPPSRRL